jgi:DNA polymerase I
LFFQSGVNGPPVPEGYVLVNTPKKLWWLKNVLQEATEFAFDVETTYPTSEKFKGIVFPKTKVCGISFSWAKEQAAYLPLYLDEEGNTYWKNKSIFDKVVETIANPLEDSSKQKFAQNGKFDKKELYRSFGIRVKAFTFDTMLAHHLIDEEGWITSGHALDEMAAYYIDLRYKEYDKYLQSALDYYDPHFRRYSSVPLEIISVYGCSDADSTYQLVYIFEPQLENQGFLDCPGVSSLGLSTPWGLFPDLVMPVQHVATMMEMRGMRIDFGKVEELDVFYTKRREEVAKIIHEKAGREFDIASPQVLGQVLFEELKIPGGVQNKIGWTTNKATLKKLASDGHDIASHILEWRSIEKLKTSYVEGVKRLAVNNRVHFSYLIHGTVTGRWSAADPNIMQLPRPENGGLLIKAMYVADEGYKLVLCDLNQAELRVAAHCSNEPVWINAFKSGHDAHAATAKQVYNLDCEVKDVKKLHPKERQDSKAVNFGVLYGQTEYGLAHLLGISVEDARVFISDYFANLSSLKAWIDHVCREGVKNGWVSNIFGRRRHISEGQMFVPRDMKKTGGGRCWSRDIPNFWLDLDRIDIEKNPRLSSSDVVSIAKDKLRSDCKVCSHLVSCIYQNEIKRRKKAVEEAKRQWVNFVVQGSTVDITNICLIKTYREIQRNEFDACPVLQIHDELGLMVADEDVEQVGRMMKDVMENTVKLRVPIVGDLVVVSRWSDKHKEE